MPSGIAAIVLPNFPIDRYLKKSHNRQPFSLIYTNLLHVAASKVHPKIP